MASLINTIKKSGASSEFISVASRAIHKPARVYRDLLPNFDGDLIGKLDDYVIRAMKLRPISTSTDHIDTDLVDFPIFGEVIYPGFKLPGELSASLGEEAKLGDLCAISLVPKGRGVCLLDVLAVCIEPKGGIFASVSPLGDQDEVKWKVDYFRVAPIRDARFHKLLPVRSVRLNGVDGEFEVDRQEPCPATNLAMEKLAAMVHLQAVA
ncbi:hypothetical protein F7U66_02105 [Vibrio parahaemolyticus]|nr:hypothetical protein [Vibrio parahaemolyticus]